MENRRRKGIVSSLKGSISVRRAPVGASHFIHVHWRFLCLRVRCLLWSTLQGFLPLHLISAPSVCWRPRVVLCATISANLWPRVAVISDRNDSWMCRGKTQFVPTWGYVQYCRYWLLRGLCWIGGIWKEISCRANIQPKLGHVGTALRCTQNTVLYHY